MTTWLDVESISDDNRRSYFRSQRARINGKVVDSPTRALEPRRALSLPGLDRTAYSFVELFTEFDSPSIASLETNPSRLDALSSRLRRLEGLGPEHGVKVCFTQFKPTHKAGWPDSNELTFMTDLAHSYSDLVPIPSVARVVEQDALDRLRAHVDKSVRLIERLNNKPLLAWLPVAMPRAAYPKLIDYYLAEDVRAFCVDFAGRIPSHLQLRPILAHLAEKRALDHSVLYGLNPRPGKFIKNAKEIPSRDFFAHGYGIDVLGGSHLRAFVPSPPTTPSRLDGAIGRRMANRKRVFVRETYGYHRLDSLGEAEAVLGKRSPVSAKDLLGSPDRTIEKAFSMDQQRVEARELRKRLMELGKRESILSYVSGKRLAAEAMPNFRRSPTLDEI